MNTSYFKYITWTPSAVDTNPFSCSSSADVTGALLGPEVLKRRRVREHMSRRKVDGVTEKTGLLELLHASVLIIFTKFFVFPQDAGVLVAVLQQAFNIIGYR